MENDGMKRDRDCSKSGYEGINLLRMDANGAKGKKSAHGRGAQHDG